MIARYLLNLSDIHRIIGGVSYTQHDYTMKLTEISHGSMRQENEVY